MCCPLVFKFSVGIGGLVIGLGQISFFFSLLYAPSETSDPPAVTRIKKSISIRLILLNDFMEKEGP